MPGLKTNERSGTRAVVRHVRVSPSKARAVLDLIRNESYGRAAEILAFSERAVSDVIAKCLESNGWLRSLSLPIISLCACSHAYIICVCVCVCIYIYIYICMQSYTYR